MIVDSHCHVGLSWYEPVETLMAHLDRHGVERAVLVQSLGSVDNSYQAQCVARFPGRLASVVRVDGSRPDAAERLADEVSRGAAGVRLQPGDLATDREPWALWRVAADLGITVSCVGPPEAFASNAFAETVKAFPALPVVIEHLGNLQPLSPAYAADVDARIMALGSLSNVYMKFHGLAEFASRASDAPDGYPFRRPVPDLLVRALDAYGAEKVLWGSDYPLVSGREGYSNARLLPLRLMSDRTEREQGLAFGGVAHRLYWPRART